MRMSFSGKLLLNFLFCILLFSAHFIFAQPQIRFEHITVQDGLPENSVSKIIQDYQGFLWFATQYGPVKYDGYKFTTYQFSSQDSQSSRFSIYSLFEDKAKDIWIGTEFGLSRYNREKDVMENFSIGNDFYLIYTICEDEGFLYFGSEVSGTGLYKFDKTNKTYTKFLHNTSDSNSIGSNFVKYVFKEDSKTIWIGTFGGGLNKFDIRTNTFRKFINIPGNINSISSNNVFSICKDKSENLWIGTDHGLNKFNKSTETFRYYSILSEDSVHLIANYITGILEDNSGYLWLTVFNYGLVKFDPVTGKSVRYKHDPTDIYSLCINSIQTIFQDKTGILWLGSALGGLDKYDWQKSEFIHYNNIVDKKFTDIVYSILADSYEGMWLATSNGLCKFNRKSNTFINFDDINKSKNKLTSKDIRNLLIDSKGFLWIGTKDGLNKYDLRKGLLSNYMHNEKDTNSISCNRITCFYEDSMNDLWIGTSCGLNLYDRKNETFRAFYNNVKDTNSISDDWIQYIFEDKKNNLWFSTNFRGLNKYNRTERTFRRYYYPDKGFATLAPICEDKKERFWIGSFMAGLFLFDRNTGEITSFSEDEGLIYNAISSIIEDNNGHLWIGTLNGLSRFNPDTYEFKNFDKNDIPVTNFLKGKLKDENGFLYFAGDGGFIVFHPDSVKNNEHIPEIVLTDFKIFNETIKPTENGPINNNINIAKEINLTYKDNNFSIEFAALDYHNPMKNQYAYILEGFNKEWIRTDASKRIASYTNLDPGEYTFRVKGSNNDGVWNEQGVSIRIIITPPWWKTWWFRTAGIFVIAGILGSTVRYITIQRYKRRLSLEKERTRISKDMHDEVGSSLTKIAILSELTGQNLENRENVRSNIQKISTSARDVVDNISEIIWAIDPKNDTLDNLLAYIRQYASEFLELRAIGYKIELPESIPFFSISAEVRRNIFLVIKEALNNIIKYAQASMVNIFAKLSDSSLEITVADNGIGFDINITRKFGNGLINMKKRLEDINGEFSLCSKIGYGTEIRLTVKLRG